MYVTNIFEEFNLKHVFLKKSKSILDMGTNVGTGVLKKKN